ncbi:hypothetical protein AMAG_14897 [Allomyces macrogynus ATCC 38327]|uniref:NADH dehydrogenase [ubiquinone] 1 beta subcomplex subunit 8, mitochondrial n=1 Tax=Allomyces macrogynus (strain ATCC 38327) TaxID=578462 RepID=A0A0L0T7I6_ALLM3|nr:hypothetical protein AMAG_14897 [Allomyces macrogynus ATCC 38327]|eukprot:KNE70773.1 hypothetical protein AMAG_14897 [Allomyces macrogynus ATCC 38327]
MSALTRVAATRAAAASALLRPAGARLASYKVQPIDQSTIPKERFYDEKDPQYYGSYKQGPDPTFGDYPLLKWEGAQQRSPYGVYDDPVERRDLGDVLCVWACSCTATTTCCRRLRPDVIEGPAWKAVLTIACFFTAGFTLFQAAKVVQKSRPNPAASGNYSLPGFEGNKEFVVME